MHFFLCFISCPYSRARVDRHKFDTVLSVVWLQQHGWSAQLLLFASVEDSDENRLIVATKRFSRTNFDVPSRGEVA